MQLLDPKAQAVLKVELEACGWPLRDFLSELVCRFAPQCADVLMKEVEIAKRKRRPENQDAADAAKELMKKEGLE